MSDVARAQDLYAAFARAELDAVRAAMADDVRWIEPPSLPYGDQVGFDAILQNVLMKALAEVEGFSTVPEEWIDGGDRVVVLGRYSGRSVATGLELDVPFAHVLRFRDGRLVEFQVHADTHRWLLQVGATSELTSEADLHPT